MELLERIDYRLNDQTQTDLMMPMQQMTHRVTKQLARLRRDSHEKCCHCATTFREGDTSHSGYDENGNPLYVGDCCAFLLAETAARNYFTPLPYDVPEPSKTLWRYTSLVKLLALLKDRALFFARADKLGDPFEGAKGIARRKEIWDDHYLAFFQEAIRYPPPGYQCELDDEQIAAEANRLLGELEFGGRIARRTTFLSCWHEAEHESEALWRIYGGDTGQAVAIRTTFERLRMSLGDDLYIDIGRVRYVDLEKSFSDINEAFFRKRKAFEHEREVRAVIRIYNYPPENGFLRTIDIEELIERIYISPLAPHWYQDVVTEAVNRFGCKAEVMTSRLTEKPFY